MAASNKKNFKRKSREEVQKKSSSSADAVTSALPLQVDDNVLDFPRGGGSRLSREERDEINAEVDAEMGDSNRKKKHRGPKSGRKLNEDDLDSLFGEGITGKLPRFANRVTLMNISPGMKLWGVIAEVNGKDVTVSLPGGSRGLVRASEAVEPALLDSTKDVEGHVLSSLFHIGRLVSCVVLQVDDDKKETGKRKVCLSLRLFLLHKSYSLEAVQEGMESWFGMTVRG